MTTIDIIIPHLNFGKYLRECLESIRQQPVDKHVILVDGGSTDNTFIVLREFPEVHVLNLMGSVKDAFVYGLNHTCNPYAMFFATDNVMLPGFLERAQQRLDADKTVGMVYGHAVKIDEASTPHGVIHGGPFSMQRLKRGNFIDSSEAVFRREAWQKMGGYPDWLTFHIDWYLWLHIGKHWNIVNLNVPVIQYRVHAQSLSTRKRRVINAECRTIYSKIGHGFI